MVSVRFLRMFAVLLVMIGANIFAQSTVELKLQTLVTELRSCVESNEFKSQMKDLGLDSDNQMSESLNEVDEFLESTDFSEHEAEAVKLHTSLKEKLETPPLKGVVSLCELLGYSIDLDGNNTGQEISDSDQSGTQETEQENEVKNYLQQLTGKTDTTVKAEIIALNQKHFEEFDASTIKAGVDQDWNAYQELKKSKYKTYRDIVKNNLNKFGDYGWALVKAGVDQDIETQ